MNPELQIIIAPALPLPIVSISQAAIALKEDALAGSALIGKVTNADQNEAASKAQAKLKSVFRLFENSRVKLKEPALEYGRAVDRASARHKDELDREDGRIAALVSEFKLAERARIAEEECLQAAELARIEREKQAELKRIADEAARVAAEAQRIQDEIDRVARMAKAQADTEAAAATTKAAREAAAIRQAEARKLAEAAEAARQETEARAAAEAVKSAAAAEAIETKAGELAYLESRPILTTKARGQSEREDWDVEIVNPYELAKFHPDCVTITPLMGKIKGVLNEGREVHGVTAKKILKTNQRAEKSKLIDV